MIRLAIIVAILLAPSLARADEKAVRDAMHDYFAGEKTGGYILIGMGLAGLGTGAVLYKTSDKSSVARGMAYPLLTVGLLHVVAGIFVNVSSVKRIDKFDDQITTDHVAFLHDERPRMAGVSTQFFVLKIVESVVAAGSLAAAYYGHRTNRPRLTGAGLAIALEMAATFAFDVVAANRAHTYRDAMAAQDPAETSMLDAPRLMISTSLTF